MFQQYHLIFIFFPWLTWILFKWICILIILFGICYFVNVFWSRFFIWKYLIIIILEYLMSWTLCLVLLFWSNILAEIISTSFDLFYLFFHLHTGMSLYLDNYYFPWIYYYICTVWLLCLFVLLQHHFLTLPSSLNNP